LKILGQMAEFGVAPSLRKRITAKRKLSLQALIPPLGNVVHVQGTILGAAATAVGRGWPAANQPV
jgi:hypothetical protein